MEINTIRKTERVVAKNLVYGFLLCTIAVGTLFYFSKDEIKRGWEQKVAPKLEKKVGEPNRSVASQEDSQQTLNN